MNTGLDALKTAWKKVVQKKVEFLGNKIGDAVTTLKNDKIVKPDENPRNVEEIITSPRKREKNIKRIKTKYYKNGAL